MRRRTLVPSTIVLTALLVTGCANDAAAPTDDMSELIALSLGGPNDRPQTWVDGELYQPSLFVGLLEMASNDLAERIDRYLGAPVERIEVVHRNEPWVFVRLVV